MGQDRGLEFRPSDLSTVVQMSVEDPCVGVEVDLVDCLQPFQGSLDPVGSTHSQGAVDPPHPVDRELKVFLVDLPLPSITGWISSRDDVASLQRRGAVCRRGGRPRATSAQARGEEENRSQWTDCHVTEYRTVPRYGINTLVERNACRPDSRHAVPIRTRHLPRLQLGLR